MFPYKCVFFDLDHTLWDYETNSGEALEELYDRYGLKRLGAVSKQEFLATFSRINAALWELYDLGKIHRDVLRTDRFHQVLLAAGIDNREMSLKFSEDYLAESPRKGGLMPGSLEVLDYLVKKYPLYIITNGFDEIQSTKMESSGITPYFKKVFTSEKVGHKKPSREIFDHALTVDGHHPQEAIMIGDNLITDIQGARNAEIDHVFFNPNRVQHQQSVTYEINTLPELLNIL
jgi:YjjG family noncanonical pyrimidine nucleotidase